MVLMQISISVRKLTILIIIINKNYEKFNVFYQNLRILSERKFFVNCLQILFTIFLIYDIICIEYFDFFCRRGRIFMLL